ncbi:SDR family oxidoreductase [Streptomyces sp. NPDC050416]|uniref:SDR family oxidoreductase n=1 Tax=Streptomyces sp. NPDC050416 TaxID=3365611 RepID=UPI0037A6A5A7
MRCSSPSITEEFLEGFPAAANLTTGRLTEPEEVAGVVRMLVSGRARALNGADLVVDGGRLTTV